MQLERHKYQCLAEEQKQEEEEGGGEDEEKGFSGKR